MLPEKERPREKALQYGIRALSNQELLALLIRHGSKQNGALDIAAKVLKESGSLCRLSEFSKEQLEQIKGISAVKSLELLACFELGRRMSFEECLKQDVVCNSGVLLNWLSKEIGSADQEMFLVVYLNVHNQILKYEILFKGTLDRSLVSVREIYQKALLCNSSRIIAVHNHPSGNPEPSGEDILVTDQLREAGALMNIQLLDHIIVAGNKSFSFKQSGLLD